ncbi:MAG: hypothetical protein Q7J86_07490 [Bacteroidota bacterium]|nr:hypothetical protein [Bacteroidota bacterium]
MTPLEKIDFVFFFIKDKLKVGGQWGYNNIWNHIEATKDVEINKTMFDEIIKKLKIDGYIVEAEINGSQLVYNLTFVGLLFDGYNSAQKEIHKLQKQNRILSWLLVFLTGVSAIYYIFEILNHYFCIYPY